MVGFAGFLDSPVGEFCRFAGGLLGVFYGFVPSKSHMMPESRFGLQNPNSLVVFLVVLGHFFFDLVVVRLGAHNGGKLFAIAAHQ